MKKCSKCGIERELTEFYRRVTSTDGRHSQCKICFSIDRDSVWKKSESVSRHEEYFKDKYGVSSGTVRSWLKRKYGIQWKDVPECERVWYINEYKRFKNRERRVK